MRAHFFVGNNEYTEHMVEAEYFDIADDGIWAAGCKRIAHKVIVHGQVFWDVEDHPGEKMRASSVSFLDSKEKCTCGSDLSDDVDCPTHGMKA